jgi:hypothetical protein
MVKGIAPATPIWNPNCLGGIDVVLGESFLLLLKITELRRGQRHNRRIPGSERYTPAARNDHSLCGGSWFEFDSL